MNVTSNKTTIYFMVLIKILGVFLILTSCSLVRAQQSKPKDKTDKAQGIVAYQKGDFLKAAKLLRRVVKQQQSDVEAWWYLGYVLNNQGEIKAAGAAFGETVKLAYDNYERELAVAKVASPNLSDEKVIEKNPQLAGELIDLLIAIQDYLLHHPQDADVWHQRSEALWAMAQRIGEKITAQLTYPSKDITSRAIITYKPFVSFTEEARRQVVNGTIRVRAVLNKDGKVSRVLVVNPLCCGLTENAVFAASQIKFKPAIKDGKPVSIFLFLEYSFSIR